MKNEKDIINNNEEMNMEETTSSTATTNTANTTPETQETTDTTTDGIISAPSTDELEVFAKYDPCNFKIIKCDPEIEELVESFRLINQKKEVDRKNAVNVVIAYICIEQLYPDYAAEYNKTEIKNILSYINDITKDVKEADVEFLNLGEYIEDLFRYDPWKTNVKTNDYSYMSKLKTKLLEIRMKNPDAEYIYYRIHEHIPDKLGCIETYNDIDSLITLYLGNHSSVDLNSVDRNFDISILRYSNYMFFSNEATLPTELYSFNEIGYDIDNTISLNTDRTNILFNIDPDTLKLLGRTATLYYISTDPIEPEKAKIIGQSLITLFMQNMNDCLITEFKVIDYLDEIDRDHPYIAVAFTRFLFDADDDYGNNIVYHSMPSYHRYYADYDIFSHIIYEKINSVQNLNLYWLIPEVLDEL